MAEITVRSDDLDGSQGDVETVAFTVDGTKYTVDLSGQNRKAFAEAVRPYVEVARKGGGRNKAARQDSAAIREWAATQGEFDGLAEKGRIPAAVTRAYDAAHTANMAQSV